MTTSRWLRPRSDIPGQSNVWIMGVLNCTPDSFSDGGQWMSSTTDTLHVDLAVQRGLDMQQQGAAIIDVGGESTRPGAAPVALQAELDRVIPVIHALSKQGCTVSVDSRKAEVMRQAIDAGATIVNDVSALSFEPEALSVVAEAGVDVCLMHMQGNPETMQLKPEYHHVVETVSDFFTQRIEACLQAGIKKSAIILDPGIGFGKRLQDNIALIRAIDHFKRTFDMPVLLGVSRKSFLGQITGAAVADRELETAVAGALGIAHGADILRVHDVPLQHRAIQIASALT